MARLRSAAGRLLRRPMVIPAVVVVLAVVAGAAVLLPWAFGPAHQHLEDRWWRGYQLPLSSWYYQRTRLVFFGQTPAGEDLYNVVVGPGWDILCSALMVVGASWVMARRRTGQVVAAIVVMVAALASFLFAVWAAAIDVDWVVERGVGPVIWLLATIAAAPFAVALLVRAGREGLIRGGMLASAAAIGPIAAVIAYAGVGVYTSSIYTAEAAFGRQVGFVMLTAGASLAMTFGVAAEAATYPNNRHSVAGMLSIVASGLIFAGAWLFASSS